MTKRRYAVRRPARSFVTDSWSFRPLSSKNTALRLFGFSDENCAASLLLSAAPHPAISARPAVQVCAVLLPKMTADRTAGTDTGREIDRLLTRVRPSPSAGNPADRSLGKPLPLS